MIMIRNWPQILVVKTDKTKSSGTSLLIQWLRLSNGGGLGSSPGQGTRSHMWCGQKKKKKERKKEIKVKKLGAEALK